MRLHLTEDKAVAPLFTERFVLSALREADFNDMLSLVTNAEVRRYLGGVRSAEDSLAGLRQAVQAVGEYHFTVRPRHGNGFIGCVTIAPHHNPVDMEISYMFLPEYWGMGYAQEAVKALLHFCEESLGLRRIVSETQTANVRSCRMLERLGYQVESRTERFGAEQTIYAYNFAALKSQSWPDCDASIRQYIEGFVELVKQGLSGNLTGVYLHGSLAMGSYFPPKSDLDFIIVTEGGVDPETAKVLNLSIARYAETRPTTGNIECSVITADTARNIPGEMPYELHYSESWHRRILDNQVTYGVRQTDPDLPAHLMCVTKRGVCLHGKAIAEVFGSVGWQSFMTAVLEDFDWIIEDENICESPFYGILNICRILQILKENNGKYLSKHEGGTWGIRNLPAVYTPLVRQAMAIYSDNTPIDEDRRRTGGAAWDRTALLAFRNYAARERDALNKE